MKALLLAAGFGTRLRPLTDQVPKCLVPVCGKPLLEYWLELLARPEIDEIVINTHYLADAVREYVRGSPYRDRITLVHEETLRGTGGTLRAVAPRLRGDAFFLAHADNLVDFDFAAFAERHAQRPPGVAITMMTFDTDAPQSCGIVEEDTDGIVVAFHEKVAKPPGNRANGAVYLMDEEVLDYAQSLPCGPAEVSLDVLPRYLNRMQTWFSPDGYLRDIGNPASLACAERDFSSRRRRYIEAAIRLAPDVAEYWNDLGNAQRAAGDLLAAERAYLAALRLEPGSTDALFNVANTVREQQRAQESLQFYALLLEIRPDFAPAWVNTGLALLDMGLLDEAQKYLERALATDPANHEASLNLARLRATRIDAAKADIANGRNLSAALISMESQVRTNPADHVALHLAGLAAFQLADACLACRRFQAAVDAKPDFLEAWIDLGTALTASKRESDAVYALQQAIALDSASWMPRYNLGAIHLCAGRYRDAANELEMANRIAPGRADVINNLGLACWKSGDRVRGEAFVRSSIELDPKLFAAYENLARLNLEKNDLLGAIEQFEKALSRLPVAPSNDNKAFLLRFELAVLYERGNLIGRFDNLTIIPFVISEWADSIGNCRSVREAFSGLVKLVKHESTANSWPDGKLVEILLAAAGRVMEMDPGKKLWIFEDSLATDPDDLDMYRRLAVSHYQDADYESAKEMWEAGLRRRDELAKAQGLQNLPHRVLDSTWYHALGHFQMLDAYLKSIELGWRARRKLWLKRVSNAAMPNPVLFSYFSSFFESPEIDAAGNNILPIAERIGVDAKVLRYITDDFYADRRDDGKFMWHMQFAAKVQEAWEAERRPPLLRLRDEDRKRGKRALRSLGIPDDSWYVCFHVRESGFWQDWDQQYPSLRNARIDTYLPAMQTIVARGGYVIRLGDPSMSRLPPMKGVIDYAHSELRSGGIDVFLWATCRFFVGVNSGPSLLPPTFGTRCLLTNFAPIAIPFPFARDRMIPKLFRDESSGRILSFDEMHRCGVALVQFESGIPSGLEVVDNRSEDIVAGVEEILELTEPSSVEEDTARQLSEYQQRYRRFTERRTGFSGATISERWIEEFGNLLDRDGEQD